MFEDRHLVFCTGGRQSIHFHINAYKSKSFRMTLPHCQKAKDHSLLMLWACFQLLLVCHFRPTSAKVLTLCCRHRESWVRGSHEVLAQQLGI